jgi:hypothetical protein
MQPGRVRQKGATLLSPATERLLFPNPTLLMSKVHLGLALLLAAATALASDEFFEVLPDGQRPAFASGMTQWETNFVGASRQSAGSLAGRVVFTSGGHGWTWGSKGWYTQRGVGLEMNEDYGNLDQMNFFVPYAFNGGATVVAFRPVGQQTNEVVLDNDSHGVKFSGRWFDSRSAVYYGDSGDVPYRFAVLAPMESATATYTPKIPAAGFYPVYTWARHGPDRTAQLYRILHTGGQTLVRVPHHMVGSGWVYLGTYYFDRGANRQRGSVVISNLQPSPGFGSVVIADAIRFGNGMGDVLPVEGGHLSGYPREEEASRYWVLRALGQGQTNVLSAASRDHQGSNVSAPTRMAREMNRESEGSLFRRIYISFHSNASGGRGAIGLWNNAEKFTGTKTPHQERLAALVGGEVNDTLPGLASPPLEVPWFKRPRIIYARDDYAFGEINNRYIEDEFDATILEVAFHDQKDDARLLRDPAVRNLVARCTYQSVVRYMNEFDEVPLVFLPEPPRNVRAIALLDHVIVAWDAPVDAAQSPPESYTIERSSDGYGFGFPMTIEGGRTSAAIAIFQRSEAAYFRVTAVNSAGTSLPSAVVGCRTGKDAQAPRVLVVNRFTAFDRLNNPRQTIAATNYVPPGAFGEMDRVIPRLNNAFDYIVQHGEALGENDAAFDSCQADAVKSGAVQLNHYSAVFWAAGQQRSNILDAAESNLVGQFLNAGGRFFISASHLADAFGSNTVSSATNSFPWPAGCDACPDRQVSCWSLSADRAGIFRGNHPIEFGHGKDNTYFVAHSSVLAADADGTHEALLYADGSGAAAVQMVFTNGARMVCFGFPFETIAGARVRAEYVSDILEYFQLKYRPMEIASETARIGELAKVSWRSEPGTRYQVQSKSDAASALWTDVGPTVSAQLFNTSLAQKTVEARVYRVIRVR